MVAESFFASDEVEGVRGAQVDELGSLKSPTIMFDPDRRPRSLELRQRIGAFRTFITDLEKSSGRRSRSRTDKEEEAFADAVAAISCNLLAASLLRPETRVVVPRDKTLMSGDAKASSPVYGRHFTAVLDLLASPDVALIDQKIGHRGPARMKGKGERTTIIARPALADHLPLGVIAWGDMTFDDRTEVLILKGYKPSKGGSAPILAFTETDKVRSLRRSVRRINAWLAAADIEVRRDDGFWSVDPSDRRLRRIFNNGSWTNGGRLFGGLWMTMPKKDRFRLIRIGGEPIVSADYKQLFPHLAYAKAKAADQSVTVPEGDLYEMLGHPESRAGWKKIVNAMLFAEKRLTAWPDETVGLMPVGIKPKEAYATVERVHAPIAGLFWKGVGYHLMNNESQILVRALEALARRKVVALPIHDAVLVAESAGDIAREVLQAEIELATELTVPMVEIERE